MLPSPSELKYFLEVCNTSNFSRAAERLGITQPSLSLSIKKLEDNIGSPLFIRSKNGVQITNTGQRLKGHAQKLLEQWNQLKVDATKQNTEICGQYKIGCHAAVANYTIPHFIEKLTKERELEVSFTHDLSRNIAEDVISHKLDLALVINPIKHPDLVIQNLLKDEVKLWKHKSLKITEDTPLIFEPSLIQTNELLKKLKKKKLNFKRTIQSPDLEVICTLVESKAGIGILPARVATRKKNNSLQVINNDYPVFLDQLSLVYRMDTPKTEAFKFILQTIKNTLQE